MTGTFNWSNFYNALCQQGPNLLLGIDGETRELILELASTTDMFWSDGLQDLMVVGDQFPRRF